MLDTSERPNVEETYISAGNTSNLVMDTREGAPARAADILVAAGWSASILGSALMRLHSEYDGAERLRIAEPAQFINDAAPRRPLAGKATASEVAAKAKALADRANEQSVLLLMGQLKSFRGVQAMAQHVARLWQLHKPEETADAVVWWWLDKTCRACSGLKFERAPGAPALSAKACRSCKASGELPLPGGDGGYRLARMLDESVERARASIKKRLRNM